MAEYDWMKDPSFRNDVVETLMRIAAAVGMKEYQETIVDRLMSYLSENRELLMEQEMIKTASQRKTKRDALMSVEVLIKRASEIAKSDKRTLLEARDFDQAYQEKLCMVWPFCGRRRWSDEQWHGK